MLPITAPAVVAGLALLAPAAGCGDMPMAASRFAASASRLSAAADAAEADEADDVDDTALVEEAVEDIRSEEPKKPPPPPPPELLPSINLWPDPGN